LNIQFPGQKLITGEHIAQPPLPTGFSAEGGKRKLGYGNEEAQKFGQRAQEFV